MSFANPHFAEPAWLWLAFLGPLALFALQRYSAWRRRAQLAQFAAPEVLGALTASHSRVRRGVKNTLLLLAIAGFGLALARPQWGEQKSTTQVLGEDIVFVVDCSRSMLATDVTPSRLERSKLAILDFIQSNGHGRVGLVAFAGQAFLQCPLTFDHTAFQDTVSALDDNTIPVAGTDIARALEEGFNAMDKSDRRKLLVLLTDGEDLEKHGIKMAEKLQSEGVVVFTIGVGTPAGSEITLVNEQGQPTLLRDSKGQVVRSRLDESTLQTIAKVTKGAYFPLGAVGEGLAKVRLAADSMEDSGGRAPDRKLGVDRFHIPIAGTIVLLVVESLIGTRKRLREFTA